MTNKKFNIVLFLIFIITLGSCMKQRGRKLPSLKENYSYTSKAPFGTFITYERFFDLFRDKNLYIVRQSVGADLEDVKTDSANGGYSLYMVITKDLVLTDQEVMGMLHYVKAGNELFISANHVDSKLLAAFFSETSKDEFPEESETMRDTRVGMTFGENIRGETFHYFYYPFLRYLQNYQKDFTRVLGVNDQGLPNYVLIFLGRGRLYLHLAPRALSNYFLLSHDNYRYLDRVLSYLQLNPDAVYWDEFYKNLTPEENRARLRKHKVPDKFSSFSVLLHHPSLKWAFYLSLAGMAFFFFFKVKRKQKSIPIKKPARNASKDFADTIGRLYFVEKNNKYLAGKMITYFYEDLRNVHSVHPARMSTKYLGGEKAEEAQSLFALIEQIEQAHAVSDDTLLELNRRIENFKQNKI